MLGIVAFVAIVMFWLGLFVRGSGHDNYVMYFHESIKGLNIGSPVVLNGVEVGKVTKIEIVPNARTYKLDIPVYIMFNDIKKIMPKTDLSERELIETMIKNGLHARLINQNLLTGQLMIELDVRPMRTVVTHGNLDGGVIEIPTALSSLSEISENVQNIPLRDVVDNLNDTLNEFKEVIIPAAKVSNDLSKKSATTLNNFNQAVEDISRAAKSLRNLSDFLEQHPESLIRGR